MPHPRQTTLYSSLTLTGVAALVATTVLIAPPASATQDAPAPFPPPKPAPATQGPARAAATTDQFIVKFKTPAAPAERAKAFGPAAAKLGTQVTDVRATVGGARVLRTSKKLGAADAEKLLAALRADPAVAHAEPDTIMQAQAALPNDPGAFYQWNLFQEPAGLRVPGAWDVTRGAGEVVAVVDTGITTHYDLDGNVLPGYDMISDPAEARDGDEVRDDDPTDEGDWAASGQCGAGSPPWDSSWHGTHVAGIIAAAADGLGIAGVAPEAKILPVRALGPCGGYTSDIIAALTWASGAAVPGVPRNENPARVINLSLGGPGQCSRNLQEAIDLANSRGAAVVVAAGNESQPAVNSSPANCRGVISVAAGTRTGALAPYSNYGSAVDLTAPGGDMTASVEDGILSTANGGAEAPNGEEIHFFAQGTSAAAPHVAGVAALLLAKMGPAATPADVEARLKATARPMPGGCLLGCGAGLVDAAAAVQPDRVRMTMVIAPGDLNSDRKPDLLARDSNGTLWLYPGNGRGGWLTRVQVGPGWNVMTAVVGSGDMNSDGKADVLARDTFGALWLYPGNGRGGLLSRVPAGSGWNVMTAMTGPGDFNGDGKPDLLARDTAGRLWLYPGNGRGGWFSRVPAGSGWNVMTALAGPGDMNGDRKADVLARDTSGRLWLYPGNGRGGWLSRVQAGNGWNYMTAIVGRGDFSGDLRNDLLAVDTSGLLWLYRGNGAGAWLGSAQVGSGWN